MPTQTPSTNKRLFEAVDALSQHGAEKRSYRRTESSKRNAAAAQSQSSIYQSLVECRILLQRCRKDDHQESVTTNEIDHILSNLLMSLDGLNRSDEASHELLDLLRQSPITNRPKIVSMDGTTNEKISDLIQECYNRHRSVWKEVLDRSQKDIRLHSGAVTSNHFQSIDTSFFGQVEATVDHEKTRFDFDRNNVDDNRLYQHILKDFLGSRANETRLPVRGLDASTSKGNVDRKASKGRKIRYTEIPKLVNFTFPLSRPDTDIETNAWFHSLFGGSIATEKPLK